MTPLTVLVVGVDSMIGRGLADAWERRGATVLGTSRRVEVGNGGLISLDLERTGNLALDRRVDLAYLCAATTNMERCEVDPSTTARINVDHTVEVAQHLSVQGTWQVFLSSNIVYDGTIPWRRAEDPVCPPAEYGRQKARTEAAILSLGTKAAVLRMGKVVGPRTEPFHEWIQTLRHGAPVAAFHDKVCAPLSLDRTVSLLCAMGEGRLHGIFQACASRDIGYDEVARHLARRLGVSEALVRAESGRTRGIRSCFLPAHTTLDISKLQETLAWTAPDPVDELFAGLGL